MKRTKADLLLHPVRMRIVQAFVGGRHLTVQQIGEMLPEIPQATLYRHFNVLRQANLLTVVGRNKVRGTEEKIYALAEQGGNLNEDDLKDASREDHLRYFMAFMANLLGDLDHYLQHKSDNMAADGFGYRQANVYLSDEEFEAFLQNVRTAVQNVIQNEPAPHRRRRTIATIFIPEPRKEQSKISTMGEQNDDETV
jgi:DNA-binding transcriptional ArsR family regulator